MPSPTTSCWLLHRKRPNLALEQSELGSSPEAPEEVGVVPCGRFLDRRRFLCCLHSGRINERRIGSQPWHSPDSISDWQRCGHGSLLRFWLYRVQGIRRALLLLSHSESWQADVSNFQYSINFPVFSRAYDTAWSSLAMTNFCPRSFVLRGSYLPIVIRAVFAPIYYGIQAYVGALAVQAMIEAIRPSFVFWHADALPASADITVAELLSFSVVWLASLPFLFLSMPALRWMFLIKVIIMPIFGIYLFTWAVTASHGFGPLLRLPTKIENGRSLGYAFCYAITTAISAGSAFTLNIPDLTRYARNPRTATIAQAISLPVCMTLIYFLGVVMAASSQVIYGQIQWNPIMIVLSWDNRAAKFFAALLFAFAMIGTNVAGNSIAFANDTMALFPKYMNLRRGQLLCAIIGFVICPWKIEARAQRSLAFLNGSTAPFLGPVAGGESTAVHLLVVSKALK